MNPTLSLVKFPPGPNAIFWLRFRQKKGIYWTGDGSNLTPRHILSIHTASEDSPSLTRCLPTLELEPHQGRPKAVLGRVKPLEELT